MKKMTWIALIAATGIGLAQAQNAPPADGSRPPRMSAEERFNQLDTNHDGKVSLAEFQAAPPMGPPGGAMQRQMTPEMQAARFKKLDTNNDGFLSLEEYKAGRAGMGGPPPPPPAN